MKTRKTSRFERSFAREFEHLLDEPGDEARLDRIVATTLDQLDQLDREADADEDLPESDERARAGLTVWISLCAALVACAALAAIWAGRGREVGQRVSAAARVEMAYAAGEVAINGGVPHLGPLSAGDRLRTMAGRACVLADPGGELCLAEQTELELAGPSDRRFRLREGRVVISVDARGAPLALTLGESTLYATRGLFSVSRHEGEAPMVQVHEGSVKILGLATHATLTAGYGLRLDGNSEPFVVSYSQEFSARGLHEPRTLWAEPETALLGITSTPTADIYLDGRALGQTPLLSFVPAGEHALELRGLEGARHEEILRLGSGERLELELELDAKPTAPAPSKAQSETPPADPTHQARPLPSAKALLDQARAAMKARAWAKAARAYQRLLETYPDDPLAPSARIAVGDLELERLGDARAALRAYDAYLRAPGPLSAEARHGRVRSLRALGRREAEQAAIEEFLREHPDSLETSQLQHRLELLRDGG